MQSSADGRRPWSVLVLLSVAQFMVILDVTVVNVALPSIGSELGFAREDLQWVVTAYVLFTGGLLLLGARAADLLGRKRIFLSGLLVFTAASLTSGLAVSPEMLVASRAAQGFGAALLSPAALSIITTTYTGEQRASALSAWGAIGAAGGAAGVLFGGVLTSSLSWEWVFFINVPIGLAAAALAIPMVPGARGQAGGLRQLDLPGALAVVSGLVVLVYALQGTATHGWGSARTIVLLGVAAGLLGLFAALERSVQRPLVPPRTWRVRSLVSSTQLMLGATGILVGAFFLNSLYLQEMLGWSALETGLGFLPLVLVIGPIAHVAPQLLRHAGARVVSTGGLALMAAGALLLVAAPDRADYLSDLLPGFLALGAGVGLLFVTISVTSMTDVGEETAGIASGLMTTAHEIGAAIGVAVIAAVATGAAGLAEGYEEGFLVAGLAAAALALLAVLRVPAVRPASAAHVGVH